MNSLLTSLASDRVRRREARIRELLLERDAREEAIFQSLPRLREIKQLLIEIGLDMARLTLRRPTRFGKSGEELSEWAQVVGREREELLAQAGRSSSELDVTWDCSDCQNTGWRPAQQVDDETVRPQEKCHCLLQQEIDDLYRISGLTRPMRAHTFVTFDSSLYPAEIRAEIEGIRAECEQFADDVSAGAARHNLLLMGGVGRGKTFLSTCIANRVLAAKRTVVYLTFLDFLDLTKRVRFDTPDEEIEGLSRLLEADLLILDDLGAEKVSDYVLQELFKVINTRINMGMPLVISTNLDTEGLEQTYSDRIFSRLIGTSMRFLLEGDDIRLIMRQGRRTGA